MKTIQVDNAEVELDIKLIKDQWKIKVRNN